MRSNAFTPDAPIRFNGFRNIAAEFIRRIGLPNYFVDVHQPLLLAPKLIDAPVKIGWVCSKLVGEQRAATRARPYEINSY